MKQGRIKKIFIVPYCHADWAWTHTRLWHEKRYNLVFNEVLDILRTHPEFRWYLDNYICQLKPFLDRSPERVPELRQRIKEGKIAVCGGFANIRPNMVGEETFVRNLTSGRKYFQGLFPEADLSVHADIVDVAVGHPQLPQILKLSGYRYFRFWRPFAALSAKKIPLEFVWRGLDGSKIIASRGSYSGFPSHEQIRENFQKELVYTAELSPTGIRWVSQGTDDTRPSRTPHSDIPIPLFDFLKEWRKKEATPIFLGTPAEYFREVEQKQLPEIFGTLDPCDVCYNVAFGGSNGLWRLRIETDRALQEAEIWDAITGKDIRHKLFPHLWENLLIGCAHATQWLFQEDFDQIFSLVVNTRHQAEKIRDAAFREFSEQTGFPEDTVCFIFNSHSFPVKKEVKLRISSPERLPVFFQLYDGNKREVSYQIIKPMCDFEVEISAEVALPAIGYNVIRLAPGKGKHKPKQVEVSKRHAATFCGNRSLILQFQNHELVRIEDRLNKFNYHTVANISFGQPRLFKVDPAGLLHVGAIKKKYQVTWQKGEVIARGPLLITYYRKGKIGPHPINQKITIFADEPLVEFKTEIDWQGMDGFLALFTPLPFTGGKLFGDIPFGVEEKRIEDEPYGEGPGFGWDSIERLRNGLFFAKSFVDYTDGKKGMALISKDGDRYFLLDRDTKSVGQILVNGILDAPGWEKFVNNQRKAVGQHTFTNYLYFHPGDWKEAKVCRRALALRFEPLVIYPSGSGQKGKSSYPSFQSFLSLKPENLILTGFYREENHFICRFYETEGRDTKGTLTLPFVPKKVAAVNFIGEKIKGTAILAHNKIRFAVRPWQIITLKITR